MRPRLLRIRVCVPRIRSRNLAMGPRRPREGSRRNSPGRPSRLPANLYSAPIPQGWGTRKPPPRQLERGIEDAPPGGTACTGPCLTVVAHAEQSSRQYRRRFGRTPSLRWRRQAPLPPEAPPIAHLGALALWNPTGTAPFPNCSVRSHPTHPGFSSHAS